MLLVGYIEFILFIRLNQKKKKSFKEAYTEMSDFRFFSIFFFRCIAVYFCKESFCNFKQINLNLIYFKHKFNF